MQSRTSLGSVLRRSTPVSSSVVRLGSIIGTEGGEERLLGRQCFTRLLKPTVDSEEKFIEISNISKDSFNNIMHKISELKIYQREFRSSEVQNYPFLGFYDKL
jgi:hypothetical protein